MEEQKNLQEQIDVLAIMTGRGFERMEAGFERMEAGFERMEKQFIKIDARFDVIDDRFDAVDARFDKLEYRVGTLEKDMKEVKIRLVHIDDNFNRRISRLEAKCV